MLSILLVLMLTADPAPATNAEILRAYEHSKQVDIAEMQAATMKNGRRTRFAGRLERAILAANSKTEPYVPTIREISPATIGRFRVEQTNHFVSHVIDSNCAAFIFEDAEHTIFIVSGINTTKLKPGISEKLNGTYRAVGLRSYTDAKGEKITAVNLEPFDVASFLKHNHPDFKRDLSRAKTPVPPKKR